MASIKEETAEIRKLISSIVGNIYTKSYFSYYGLCQDKSLFALYKANKFYLYIPDELIPLFLSNENVVLLEDKEAGIHSKNFYAIPPALLADRHKFAYWVTRCLEQLKKQHNRPLHRKRLIRYLPNMNAHTEKTLKKIGIHSVDDFIKTGEIAIFIEMIKQGLDVDSTMLFKLYGATHHQLIYTISAKEKRHLLCEANNALYKAGLRKRFRS